MLIISIFFIYYIYNNPKKNTGYYFAIGDGITPIDLVFTFLRPHAAEGK